MESKQKMEETVDKPQNIGLDLKIEVPEFATEAEEAAWWPTQEDKLFEAFEKAAGAGKLRAAAYVRKPLPTTTIRLDPADIALAKEQAAAKGLRYQTYLKMVLHEALRAGKP